MAEWDKKINSTKYENLVFLVSEIREMLLELNKTIDIEELLKDHLPNNMIDRKSTRMNSIYIQKSRMPSSA